MHQMQTVLLWLLSYIQFGINRWKYFCWCNLTFSVHWNFFRKKAWTATAVTLQRSSDWEHHSALPDRSWCITDAFSIITDSCHHEMIYNQETRLHVLDNCVSFERCSINYLVNIDIGSPFSLLTLELQFLKGNFNVYLQDFSLSKGWQTNTYFNAVCMKMY